MEYGKNKKKAMVVLAVIFVAFTVIAFAIPFAKNGVFWTAYLFGLLAMAAQLYAWPRAFKDGTSLRSKFYGFPIVRVAVFYLAAQLVLSLLFMALSFIAPLWAALILFILLAAAAVIGFVAVDIVREEVERQDVQLKKDVTLMRSLQAKAITLVEQGAGSEAAEELKKLAEALQYSDPVSHESLAEAENELKNCMDNLSRAVLENDSAAVKELTRKASLCLAERNRLCKLCKAE